MNQNDLNAAHKLLSGSEGWGALSGENAEKQNYEAALQQYHHAERICAAFNGGAGADCLAALTEQFFDRPTWPVQVTHGADQQAYGYIREGQKSVITAIRNAQALVKKGPPAQPQTSKENIPQ